VEVLDSLWPKVRDSKEGFQRVAGWVIIELETSAKKANLIKKYNMSRVKKHLPTWEIKKYNLIRGKKDLPTIKKSVKLQNLQRLDLGVYQAHIPQIFKKLPVQLVQ
jgi:hypothetical protein